MVALVTIVSRHDLRIEIHHRNQPSKSKLVLYIIAHYLNNRLKQLYRSSKMEHFSYKGECGIYVSRNLKEELAWAIDKQP